MELLEKPQLPDDAAVLVTEVTPLVQVPGRLMLTDMRLYLQYFNNIEAEPVKRFDLKDVSAVYKRRFIMRNIGLEIVFVPKRRRRDGGRAAALGVVHLRRPPRLSRRQRQRA